MKCPTNKRNFGLLAAALALSVCLVMTLPPSAGVAGETKQDNNGFVEKMEKWQGKMSEKFRDTWKSLRGASKEKSIATASVDLREDKDSYTVRLNLPDRDLEKVEIKLEGETLRIVAPAGEKAGRYEQTIALAGVASHAPPKIERKQKDNMIVVTVPKGANIAGAVPPLVVPDPSLLAPLSAWEADVFARMKEMRRDMDRAFDDAFREFEGLPEHRGFFDEPRFGSSLDLKEEGDHYVVRTWLPDRDMQDINVTVQDRTLKIEAKEQETKKKEGDAGALHSMRKAAYSQLLTLPGPVQSDKMKVEKKEGMLVVTLPKTK